MSIEMLSAEHGWRTARARCHGGMGLDHHKHPGRPGQPQGDQGGQGKVQIAHGLIRQLRVSTGGPWDVHEHGEASHGYRIVGAQRVSPAVTRLTVYRWPQVMRPGEEQASLRPNIFVATTGFKHEMLRIVLSEFDAELE